MMEKWFNDGEMDLPGSQIQLTSVLQYEATRSDSQSNPL